ncbi:MAG: hypothetical protein HKN44_13070, partial [Ilumatobacter sp.]|nr:hypothetical protein [Ilumatobacter sp.]
GVLNTDNVTISGETIDYGPCAFMDEYDPATVFSSIDHGGRYAYANQAPIMQWNLARLAETLLPLIDDDVDAAVERVTAVLRTFPDRYDAHRDAAMAAKIGLDGSVADAGTFVDDLLALLHAQRVDFTSAFRSLSSLLRGDPAPARALFAQPAGFDEWAGRWLDVVKARPGSLDAISTSMDGVNPLYIPRNHLVEHALTAATDGDLGSFERLLDVLARPFTERPGLDEFTTPAPPDFGPYRTFCGT